MFKSTKARKDVPVSAPHASMFPYQESGHPRKALDYRLMARIQLQELVDRRTAFVQRLDAFKQSDEPLRSFPTPAMTPRKCRAEYVDDMLATYGPDPANYSYQSMQQATQAQEQHQVVEAPQVAGPSFDDSPFEAPPLDANAYGNIEVDDEYDLDMPSCPEGSEAQPDGLDWSKATVGEVTSFGKFPYRYKQGESKVFMIRLGTQDHWGVDLERVVREFNLQKGDKIALMCIGKVPVIVPVRVLQTDGSYKTEEQEKMRNTWVCKRLK